MLIHSPGSVNGKQTVAWTELRNTMSATRGVYACAQDGARGGVGAMRELVVSLPWECTSIDFFSPAAGIRR